MGSCRPQNHEPIALAGDGARSAPAGWASKRDWYLSVEDRRDVIEQPIADDLDVSGWELRKALRLLRKSNPPLLE